MIYKVRTNHHGSTCRFASNSYWQPTLVIACSPLDAGQTNVMTARHERPISEATFSKLPKFFS